jgi:ComF family protein
VRLEAIVSAVSEVFLPSLCLHCSAPLPGGAAGICAGCLSALAAGPGARCRLCGRPSAEAVCLHCEATPPPWRGTVSLGDYQGVLRTALLALKHRGHEELAAPLAAPLITRIGEAPWAEELDSVTAVPTHPLHRLRRGWSAARQLAVEIARGLDLPCLSLLARRGLGRQAPKSRAQRLRLPARAFAARRSCRRRNILLVDDVTTTGATLHRATRALLGSGAASVSIAVLAVTPDSRRSP